MKTRRDQITQIGRLLKRADFLRVQGSGKKWVTPTCIVQMASAIGNAVIPDARNAGEPGPSSVFPAEGPGSRPLRGLARDDTPSSPPYLCRYGMTVTKKIWKNSVDRNRVRRRVRAVLLDVLAARVNAGHIPPQTDFVILPRASALTAPIAAIEKDLAWAIKRLTALDTDPKYK